MPISLPWFVVAATVIRTVGARTTERLTGNPSLLTMCCAYVKHSTPPLGPAGWSHGEGLAQGLQILLRNVVSISQLIVTTSTIFFIALSIQFRVLENPSRDSALEQTSNRILPTTIDALLVGSDDGPFPQRRIAQYQDLAVLFFRIGGEAERRICPRVH